MQKTEVPQVISAAIVAHQVQGFIRIFFSFDNLFHGGQPKFLEAEGISGHIPIEGAAVQQPYNQSVRYSVLKQVGDIKTGQVALHAEGADFTADGWVGGDLAFIVSLGRQTLVDGVIQTQLTEMKP